MFIYFVLGYASVDKIVNRFGKMSVKKNVRRVPAHGWVPLGPNDFLKQLQLLSNVLSCTWP